MKDTPPSNKKAMALCVSRLQEALNLLPRTGTERLGESIAATLSARSAERNVLRESSRAIQSPQDGEQQDLRQQQACKLNNVLLLLLDHTITANTLLHSLQLCVRLSNTQSSCVSCPFSSGVLSCTWKYNIVSSRSMCCILCARCCGVVMDSTVRRRLAP